MRWLIKSVFYKLRLDYIIPVNFLLFIAYYAKLSKFVNNNKSKGFSDFFSLKYDYNKREQLFEHVILQEGLNNEKIDYLEFGVANGASMRWWTNKITNSDSKFYGFDTFIGLPEKWGYFPEGHFDAKGQFPDIEDERLCFIKGLFQDSLLPFLSKYENQNKKVIHLDADLYSSTLYIMAILFPYLRKGDVIFFDEFSVPLHEHKAFSDLSSAFYLQYEILGSVNNFFRLAIKIK